MFAAVLGPKKLFCGVVTVALASVLLVPQPALAVVPTNDDFDNAKVITRLPYRDSENTKLATSSSDDPSCEGRGNSVWYRYTAHEDTRLEADTRLSDYDTTLSAYTGNRGDLIQRACNNDDPIDPPQSLITVDVKMGQTIYFMVATCCGNSPPVLGGGNLRLEVEEVEPPLEVELTVTPTGLVDLAGGEAIVRGTFTCDDPVQVRLSGEMRQSDNAVKAYLSRKFFCDEETVLWTVRAEPYKGSFGQGLARVDLAAYEAQDRSPDFRLEEAKTVRLKGCTIIGTPGNNRLEGSPRDDIICGLAGNDRIIGKGGDDKLIGGPGRDTLLGQEGRDFLVGGQGKGVNLLDGGPDVDVCKPETRRDRLFNCEK